jgi:hypothetical protein
MTPSPLPRILCLNLHGKGGQDEARTRRLCRDLPAEVTFFDVDRARSRRDALREIDALLRSQPWNLVYQEGTGIAGGWALIRAARQRGVRYIVSSGDPVGGFFRVTSGPVMGAAMALYERRLYRASAGFVGWTPYLTGRALQMGAPRGVTVEGGADFDHFVPYTPPQRLAARQKFGLPAEPLVCGVVGSLKWTARQSYCYGLELIETLKRLNRSDVTFLIVGDGDGRPHLERALPDALRAHVVFTGRLPYTDVVAAINALDIGFITQTLDELGSFRLTTKLPEYLACGVPVAMSPIPGFYDYALEAGWPLPAFHPASSDFAIRCAHWLDGLERAEVRSRACAARPLAERRFDYAALAARFQAFVTDVQEAGR